MATTRLRQTFKYPSDDEHSDDSRDELDEEEQEQLIEDLSTKNAKQNEIYTLVFSVLPLTISPLFAFYLVTVPSRTSSLLCVLAITSLFSTAYVMRYVPLVPHRTPLAFVPVTSDSPIEQYLIYLNMVIACLLTLAAWSVKGRQSMPEAFWLVLLLPVIVFGIVLVAKKTMADVHTGIGDLNRMRYDYKGA